MTPELLKSLLPATYAGDNTASNQLFRFVSEHLTRLAHALLANHRVHRWEETDDLVQTACLKLFQALSKTQPSEPAHFLNLATQHVRWALGELCRRAFGKTKGIGAKHVSDEHLDHHQGQQSLTPQSTAWYEALESLTPEERCVVEWRYYFGYDQETIAPLLGISVRSVQKLYAAARVKLSS